VSRPRGNDARHPKAEGDLMRIVMMTNTYLPMVGGVSRSVARFSESLRKAGHHVLVVAPTFDGSSADERDVIRIPALQRFNGSDFSVKLPLPGLLPVLEDFAPDVIHAHHPFLLGDTAVRTASHFNKPIVFTHHTMYEHYTHYVPGDSLLMRQFVITLATEYANLCDHVVAPSESIAAILRARGVTAPLSVIPSGIEADLLGAGNRTSGRGRLALPADASVVGHVGRLAAEKNLRFLTEAVALLLERKPEAWFLVVGDGPLRDEIRRECSRRGVADRLRMAGVLDGPALADAYAAMDLFAFASHSETQGLVLAEAMAAGVPVVALDASGARDVVDDGRNGRLLAQEDAGLFAACLADLLAARAPDRAAMVAACRETGRGLSVDRCGTRLLRVYTSLDGRGHRGKPDDGSPWATALRRLEEEWRLLAEKGVAAGAAIGAAFPAAGTGDNGEVG
jgi:1,2-diacylglycerol 3-alpha-glucosyltransferase